MLSQEEFQQNQRVNNYIQDEESKSPISQPKSVSTDSKSDSKLLQYCHDIINDYKKYIKNEVQFQQKVLN